MMVQQICALLQRQADAQTAVLVLDNAEDLLNSPGQSHVRDQYFNQC